MKINMFDISTLSKNKLVIFPVIIGISLLLLFFVTKENNKLEAALPEINPITSMDANLICQKFTNNILVGNNNPDNQGIISLSEIQPESNSFQIKIENNQLTTQGILSGFTEGSQTWTLSENNEEYLVGYLQSKDNSLIQEFFNILIVKDSGHGIISNNRVDTYVNKQAYNSSTYFACKPE